MTRFKRWLVDKYLPAYAQQTLAEENARLRNCIADLQGKVDQQTININEAQLCKEFENERSRIIASADMVAMDETGRRRLSDDLFVAVDDDPSEVGITIFSPTLREQINALRSYAGQIADPINNYLLEEIARRISEAGQLTSTAQYQIWRAQTLGLSQQDIKKQLKKLLGVSNREIDRLLTQSAEVGYRFDLSTLPTSAAIPFEQNEVMQQIVSAAVKLAQDDFTNIVQTLGMVDPYDRAMPLQSAYHKTCDFAFQQVATGAADYTTAIRQATKNLAAQGIRVIDYKSGVHTSLEAAVRRNIMGGMGLMQEQISQANHDDMGADGWEISAHSASAPDHEPIQGKQYSDAEYARLNASLKRRIGALNCGHAAFPIVLGVSRPQYSDAELEQMRTENETGVTCGGKHYTGYEATQMQRKLERSQRCQKRRILTDEATGDSEKLQTDQIKLQRLRQEYARFSKATGLRTQNERAQVAGFGRKEAAKKVVANGMPISYTNSRIQHKAQQAQGALGTDKSMLNASGNITVDIEIDNFTPCLVERESGKIVDTTFSLATTEDIESLKAGGWLFDWKHSDLSGSDIYKLTVEDTSAIQGLVAIENQQKSFAFHLSLAESVPHNKGANKVYDGVGGHLFAVAVGKSYEAGYGGFIYFEAKNLELVKHYQEKFGALLVARPHKYSMIIDEVSAEKLLNAYTLKE